LLHDGQVIIMSEERQICLFKLIPPFIKSKQYMSYSLPIIEVTQYQKILILIFIEKNARMPWLPLVRDVRFCQKIPRLMSVLWGAIAA
jgi:hypothetical protein